MHVHDGRSLECDVPFRRSLSSRHLAQLLQTPYDEADRSWRLKDVKRQIRKIDEGAVKLAASVLKRLQGLQSLTPKMEMELAQGFAAAQARRGWGVALHIADAATVKRQALELSRKRFHAVRRRNRMTRARFRKAALASVLEQIKEYESDDSAAGSDGDGGREECAGSGGGKRRRLADDGERQRREYLVGYTLVPPYMMGDGHRNFNTSFAMDGASKRGTASGVRDLYRSQPA